MNVFSHEFMTADDSSSFDKKIISNYKQTLSVMCGMKPSYSKFPTKTSDIKLFVVLPKDAASVQQLFTRGKGHHSNRNGSDSVRAIHCDDMQFLDSSSLFLVDPESFILEQSLWIFRPFQ